MRRIRKDLTGKRFARLVVIALSGRTANRQTLWLCKCDCGNRVKVRYGNLTSGNTESCGCLKAGNHRIHGMSRTPIHNRWQAMLARCNGTSSKEANRCYHDRGIRVCKAWKKFENFYAWATTHGYRHELTLERRNNNGPYSPRNCVFASRTVQNNNSRNNRLLTLHGETKPLRQWARAYRMSESTIHHRLHRGWSDFAAITTPSMR